jgi:hypothetical protein
MDYEILFSWARYSLWDYVRHAMLRGKQTDRATTCILRASHLPDSKYLMNADNGHRLNPRVQGHSVFLSRALITRSGWRPPQRSLQLVHIPPIDFKDESAYTPKSFPRKLIRTSTDLQSVEARHRHQIKNSLIQQTQHSSVQTGDQCSQSFLFLSFSTRVERGPATEN